jgi:hypothetical protein
MKPLTKEQLRDNAAAMLAFAEGKPIQFVASGYRATTPIWADTEELTHIHDIWHRPKPQPVSRPWSKPEDVPGPVCWIKSNSAFGAMVTGLHPDGLNCDGTRFRFRELSLAKAEYSTDRKTWKPCTVEE